MNFDKKIERKNTACIKYDSINERFQASEDTCPLWVADMDFATPKFIINSLEEVLDNEILGYPHIDESVYESIIFWQKHRYDLEVKKEEILLMPTVLSALSSAICALSALGDEVIIQTPVYPPFFKIVEANGRTLIQNTLRRGKNKYKMDLEDLQEKITKKTKLLILCNPHNPIGRAWSKKELVKLALICAKNNIIILSDEIHSDIVFEEFHSILEVDGFEYNMVVFNAPTKSFNIAGLKVSYIICKDEEKRELLKKEIDKRYIDDLNSFATAGIKSAYSQEGLGYIEQLNSYLKKNVEFTHDYLQKKLPKLVVNKNEATYLIWLDFEAFKLTHEEIKMKLIHSAKVLLNSGTDFSKELGEKCFRINVALPHKELKKALKKIITDFAPLS